MAQITSSARARRIRFPLIVASIAAAAAVWGAQARADIPNTGQWLVDQHSQNATVDLTFKSSGSDGSHTWNFEDTTTVARTSVSGLTDDQLESSGTHVTFRIVRDAGWFDCDGWAANGHASGSYRFTPDPAFARGLAARGIASPDAAQSLRLAVSNVGMAYVDSLRSLGVTELSPDNLVRLSDHGVSPAYVAAMSSDGYRFHVTDDLVRLVDHGVDPAYVADMRAAGYPNLSADDLVRLRDHGVDADFVKRMSEHGYTKLSVDDLIRLRDNGF